MKKIPIILILLLILGIMGISGCTNQNNNTSMNTNYSANQTTQNSTPVINTTSNQTSTQKSKTNDDNQNLISASKAISITKVKSGAQGDTRLRFTASLVKNGGKPYYLITVYGNDKSSPYYGEAIGGAKVDARTGAFLGGMG
ncbi:PepSY domain-containing protein [Methanobacterium sp. ACI-7]|uniref:PepSY domain-containing protein n=1 Tax=unclassified Methanobacterium TaxID=2627676 RepID=UPI0039C1F782